MQLHKLQVALLGSIFQPAQVEIDAGEYITTTAELTASQQLDIYRGSIISGMSGALENTYPVCKQLVGPDFFDAMAHEYIINTPSTHPDLNIYGSTLAEFIAGFEPASELPYLSDVARLEWLWAQVFSAADDSGKNLEQLADLTEDQMLSVVFRLSPTTGLLQSDYPINAIWNMHHFPETGQDEVINLDQGGVKLLVWRDGLEMKIEVLDDIKWLFLSLVQQQQAFSVICETLLRHFPDADAGQALAATIQPGWVQSFRVC